MLKTALLVLLTLVIAIGGGGASVWYALRPQEDIGAVTVGAWTAYPDIGTADADPYSKARTAREGVLSLGRTEGLAFIAQRDSAGNVLRRECTYEIDGPVPAARFWTLHAANASQVALKPTGLRAPALHAYAVLRLPDNSAPIVASRHPSPGNWLAIEGSGEMALVLTLYDTPVATSSGVADIALPAIVRAGCDA